MRRPIHYVALSFLLAATTAFAATHTWTGANSSLWSDPGNWTGGTPAGDPNADLIFPGSAVRTTSTDDLAGVAYLSSLSFYQCTGCRIDGSAGSSLAISSFVAGGCFSTAEIALPIQFYGGGVHGIAGGGGLACGSATLDFSAPISGAGPDSISVTGGLHSGVFVRFAADSPFSGGISVGTAAVLEIDASFAASSLTVNGGQLSGTGTIASLNETAGIVRPGTTTSNGILTVTGNAVINGFQTRLNGTGAGTGYDQLQVGASTTHSGGLSVGAAFLPPIGTVFTLINSAGGLTGTFNGSLFYTVNCMALQAGYTATTATLTRVAGGPPLSSTSITASGGQATYCNGTGGTATAVDSGGCGDTHQWGFRSTPGGAITDISGQTGTSYLITGTDFPGAGAYYLVERSTGPNGEVVVSNELTITVLGPTVGTALGSTTICAGQTAQLRATGGSACAWSPIAGLSDPNSCNPTASPSATTTYTVTFSGNCFASNQPTVTVTVNPLVSSKLNTVTPCRAVDTRNPDGPLGGPALTPSASRSFVLTGTCGVPPTARAVAANILAISGLAMGDLRIYPSNLAMPLASTVNFFPNQNRANNAVLTLPCDGSGSTSVFNESTGSSDVVIDVFGYFE